MAAWADLFPDMMGRIHGCPAPLAEFELRRAAIKFFSDTRVWKVTLDPVVVPANTAEFDLLADVTSQYPVRLEKVWANNRPIQAYTADSLDVDFKDNWMSHTGTPTGLVQMVPNIVRLYPIPVDTTPVQVRASIRPSDAATVLPDEFLRYRRAFTDGALAELMSYEGEAWANPKRAEFFRGRFQEAIDAAAAQATHSFGRGRVRSRPKLC